MNTQLRSGLRGLYMLFRSVLTIISPTLNTRVVFFMIKRKIINLNEPLLFDEKISWLKLNEYNNSRKVLELADKFMVRKYIEEKGYGKYLNDLYGKYNSYNEIDWDLLPNKFVLKWSNGNGYNFVCNDKKSINHTKLKRKIRKWKRSKPYLKSAELQYKNSNAIIICEKHIGDENNNLPLDYKLYCFHGRVVYIMVCLDRDLETRQSTNYFFNTKWEFLPINIAGSKAPINFTLPKPDNLDDMIDFAESMTKEFKFVRFDLYNDNGRIIFGEMTFTPSGGYDKTLPTSLDLELGRNLIIV